MRSHRVGSMRLCSGCERPVPTWVRTCQTCGDIVASRRAPACPARRPCRVGRHPMPPLLAHDTDGWLVDDCTGTVRGIRCRPGFVGSMGRHGRMVMLGTRRDARKRPGPDPGRRHWLARLREALRW